MKTARIHIVLDPAELAAAEDFRYAARIPTRGEALRRLIRLGLEKAHEAKATAPAAAAGPRIPTKD